MARQKLSQATQSVLTTGAISAFSVAWRGVVTAAYASLAAASRLSANAMERKIHSSSRIIFTSQKKEGTLSTQRSERRDTMPNLFETSALRTSNESSTSLDPFANFSDEAYNSRRGDVAELVRRVDDRASRAEAVAPSFGSKTRLFDPSIDRSNKIYGDDVAEFLGVKRLKR